jgi:hypothetical protein
MRNNQPDAGIERKVHAIWAPGRRRTIKKLVGIADNGRFIFWDSLADTKIECRKKILEKLYPLAEDPPNWSRWEIREIEIKV